MVGRPSKITTEILEKLDAAFMVGHTDEEACLIAEIDPKTLYNYCNRHSNYSRRKELLKNHPKLAARRNIVAKINAGDVDLSKWYLERKARDEFNVKQEVVNTIEVERYEQLNELSNNIRTILETPSQR